ncbi:MAG: hypothetical protein ACP5SH_24880 [Syntrophobacteraceae bacterium]
MHLLDFPDHHSYSPEDLLRVLHSASQCGAALILTTAKDSMRIPPFLRRLFRRGRNRNRFRARR